MGRFRAIEKIVVGRTFNRIGADEVWTHIGNKGKKIWIWTAVFDNKLNPFHVGGRKEEDFWKLYCFVQHQIVR